MLQKLQKPLQEQEESLPKKRPTESCQYQKSVNKLRFKNNITCTISVPALEAFYEKIYNLPTKIHDSDHSLGRFDPFLDAGFSYAEVKNILGWLKSGKSPGPDGISDELYHWIPPSWIIFLTNRLNKAYIEYTVLSSWCTSEHFSLYKKDDPTDPLNCRGIALTKNISKILTTLISSRLSTWCEQNNVFPEYQGGFRDNRSCEDNVFTLQARVCLELNKPRGKLYAAFVYFRRTFDFVVHNLLWDTLHKAGISCKVIRVLKDLYDKAGMEIKLDSYTRSKNIEITKGVLQGDNLSPTSFAIFLHDIDKFFKKNVAISTLRRK